MLVLFVLLVVVVDDDDRNSECRNSADNDEQCFGRLWGSDNGDDDTDHNNADQPDTSDSAVDGYSTMSLVSLLVPVVSSYRHAFSIHPQNILAPRPPSVSHGF